MDATVTREKHPGRVASGKRLVEWNRNNNKKGLQEPKEPKNDLIQKPAQEPQVKSSQALYAGSGVIVVAALLAAWYFLRKKPAEVKTTSPLKKHDIYSMR